MGLFTHVRTFNPRWVITVLAIAVSVVNLYQCRWKKGEVITGDVKNYYSHLPRVFYGDSLPAAPDNPGIGASISYLPFFGLAHVYSKAAGCKVDGYSAPYQFAVLFSSLVYYIIGLIFLGKLLRLHFPGLVSSLTLLAVSFGTNMFYYLTGGGGMPHAVSFMLLVLFLYQVVSWSQMRDIASAAQMGLLLGAMWLVRPVNVVFVLVFVLFDVRRFSEVQAGLRLLVRRPFQLFLIVLCGGFVVMAQWLYWRWQTGAFQATSYPGDTFHFVRPDLIGRLFASPAGWLTSNPLMILAVAGFFFLRGSLRMYAWAVPVTFLVYLSIVLCQNYDGGFGQRGLIDAYPLLSIPFAAFVYKLRRLGGWYRRALYGVIITLLAINLYNTWQAGWN